MKRFFPMGMAGLALLWSDTADAKPIAPTALCEMYPDAPACTGGIPACTYCHQGAPPPRNSFGAMVEANLLPGTPRPLSDADFLDNLPVALSAIEEGDADGDSFSNVDEILAGTYPYDEDSFPNDAFDCNGGTNEDWNVCGYDPAYVFKKLRLDFCGKSPTYAELEDFRAEADPMAALDRALDECLDSAFWLGRHGQLWKLANDKIRPLQAIKAGEDRGPIPLGDYYDDYALFTYAQIDDHDARDVLLGDYFVTRVSDTEYEVGSPSGQQGVVQARRAGMLTTRWNLVLNVMFTALPRTAAAQAYRSFLGMDIAKLQGLMPIPNEPYDYDAKGVQQDACAVCHSTLDPASYPFKNYQGLTGSVGQYDPDRIEDDFRNEGPNIMAMPEAGAVLGQPVADLVEWAQVAANSDQFAVATVMDYWMLLMGRPPEASEQQELQTLWTDLKGDNAYSVERMLHDFIKTEAYGVP